MAITRKNAGGIITVPVKAEAVINAGGFVLTDSTGYAVAGSDLSGGKFIGVAVNGADATGLTSGAVKVKVYRQGIFKMAATSIAITSQGLAMYCTGAATFDETASNGVCVGKLVKYVSANLGWIDISDTGVAGAQGVKGDKGDTGTTGFPAIVITVPAFTGWVKDGTDKTIPLPALELPVAGVITAAFATLGIAPGTGKTLSVKVNDTEVVSIAEDSLTGENKALAKSIALDTDIVVKANETAGGAAVNCNLMLVIEPAA